MRNAFILFFGIFILLYGAINYYIGIRGWQALSSWMPFFSARIYWVVFWLVAMSYILGRIMRRFIPYALSNAVTLVGSYWLAIMFYSFLIILTIDLIRLLDKIIGFVPQNIKNNAYTVQYLGAFVIGAIVVTMIYGVWNARNPKVVSYDITIPKQAGELKSLHIVALSDIHLGVIVDEKRMQEAVNIINGLNADVVLFAGDTVDEDVDIFKERNMVDIFNKIKSKYGSYAILGNHEYIGGHTKEAIGYIEKSGIKVLRDDYVKVADSFYLVGRDDRSGSRFSGVSRKNISDIMNGIDKSFPIIMMDHQPQDLSEPAQNGVDLQLSGHTHRGQMFPNNLITRKIFENDWGYLKKGKLQTIVSSGFGTWGPPVRIGSRSEILDITVRFK